MAPTATAELAVQDATSNGMGAGSAPAAGRLAFDDLYEASFDFVWRTLRRYGVPDQALDDAVQDVYMVVHGKLATFEGRSSLRTWLFGIARRVARDHRPSQKTRAVEAEQLDALASVGSGSSHPESKVGAARLLESLLSKLSGDQREVFILCDLEGWTLSEAAEALDVNQNTIYSRLRAARAELEQAVVRVTASERWRSG